jgi:hypothetical protein
LFPAPTRLSPIIAWLSYPILFVYPHRICSNLDQDTVVHVWKEKTTMDAVLTAGYNALLSDEDLWYLE